MNYQGIPNSQVRIRVAPLGALAAGVLVACAALSLPAGAAEKAGASADANVATAASPHGKGEVGWALFETYCVECHNAEDWAGGVAFDTLQPSDIPQNIEVLEKVVRKMRSQQMPPGGKKVPDRETRAAFVAWMEGNLDEAGKAHPDPGRVGLHRLNRKEYANSVRDLLGIEINPAELLPRDEPREGF
ncbi:MAG: hypothetical protein RL030_129, partial [Pseudomonadota bacterium]